MIISHKTQNGRLSDSQKVCPCLRVVYFSAMRCVFPWLHSLQGSRCLEMGENFQLLECSLESAFVRKQALLASHAVEVASGDILPIFHQCGQRCCFIHCLYQLLTETKKCTLHLYRITSVNNLQLYLFVFLILQVHSETHGKWLSVFLKHDVP